MVSAKQRRALKEATVGIALGSQPLSTAPTLVYTAIRWTGGRKVQSPTLVLCSSICCAFTFVAFCPYGLCLPK